MPENDENLLHVNKKAAYYQELVSAWINTSMEQDKSILSISVAGIGVFITLLTTSKSMNFCSIVFAFLSMVSFLITTVLILIIFSKNTDYIEKEIQRENTAGLEGNINAGEQRKHAMLDIFKNLLFSLGIVFAIIFVIVFVLRNRIIVT